MPTKMFTPKQTLVWSFTAIILIGAVLLMLPISNRSGESIPFINALFTAASATCVTGLVVYDTWTQFSLIGQIIILILIQIGGLGFMTIAILFPIMLGKRIGLRHRSILKETVNAINLGGIVKLARRIIIGTAVLEILGAVILSFRFVPVFGWAKGIWYGVFHSISAFCNAGFDLMGSIAPYASFTPFADEFLTSGVLMFLIIAGGIGFVIWDDVIEKKGRIREFNLHTKITLSFTAVVLLVSFVGIILLEWDHGLAGFDGLRKLTVALFHSVTPRTAGFNTIDISFMSEGGIFLTMLLMIIGAGPGSTGGGIKITTFAVMVTAVIANLRGQNDSNIFFRRLQDEQIRRAFSMSAFYIMLTAVASLVIFSIEPFSFKEVLFEALSAIGTVGLSLGITRDLLSVSKLVIILLMYAGRLGSITVFLAMAERRKEPVIRYAKEKVVV